MNVLLSGATGFLGTKVARRLRDMGHRVVALSRKPLEVPHIVWKPDSHIIDWPTAERFDAVLHLAGENIAASRWTVDRKRKLWTSRVDTTAFLGRTLLECPNRIRVFVSASAVGYYGSRGDEVLTEQSPKGKGFLADLCNEWEQAAKPICDAGIRTAHLRLGLVLDSKQGALARMLPLFRLGLGGRLGTGRQWMSWITAHDAVEAMCFLLGQNSAQGPFNLTAPNPVENREFTRVLGRSLNRPTFLPVPSFGLRLVFGELADEALLASSRVQPARLLSLGFRFAHEHLEPALQGILH